MQLQIQTLNPKFPHQSSQQPHEKLPSIRDLFCQPKIVYPSEALLSQLRQVQLTAKADYHHLTALRKKAFMVLCEENYQAQFTLMEKGFQAFKYCLVQRRITSAGKEEFIAMLSSFCKNQRWKKDEVTRAIKFYQNGILRRVLYAVQSMIKIRKKSEELETYSMKKKSIEFIHLLEENLRSMKNQQNEEQQVEEYVGSIYSKKIYSKVFQQWQVFGKSSKLQRKLKHKALLQFVRKLIDDKRQTISIVQTFQTSQTMKQKRRIFETMKQTKLQSQCLDWYKYRLQKLCFKKWLQHHEIAKQQKQINDSNQIILKHYLDEKHAKDTIKIEAKYFGYWKSWWQLQTQNKKQTQILKSFAELKEKQYLERKYFLVLKQNRNYEKAIRLYHKKLKKKVIQSLKKNVIHQRRKLQNVRKFIQQRTITKYFDRILKFNKQQKERIKTFLLRKLWFKFTFNIVSEYFQRVQKAKNYHQTSLKFKTLFGLKKNVEIHKKADYCAFYINIEMPIKKWNRGFRMRKMTHEKQLFLMKRIFFEWKVLTLRKALSKDKSTNPSELFVESIINAKNRQSNNKSNFENQKSIEQSCPAISEEQISFFKKMNNPSQEMSSDSQSDEIHQKVDSLLTKIRTQRSQNKNQLIQLKNVTGFSNERLLFSNQTLSKRMVKETIEKIRLPTWSSPGTDYRVSVFDDEDDD